jgi:hypothetical protein
MLLIPKDSSTLHRSYQETQAFLNFNTCERLKPTGFGTSHPKLIDFQSFSSLIV